MIETNNIFHQYPKIWTKSNVTEAELNRVYEALNSNLDPIYEALLPKFEDPRPGVTGAKPCILIVDSTKIQIGKAQDRNFQSSTWSAHKGRHCLTGRSPLQIVYYTLN